VGEVLIEGRRLDVFEGLDFSFNYGIADVRDPNKRSTEYTKTIKCPGTPNNDKLFGHIYDVNISNKYISGNTNIEVNFNANKKATATVMADSVTVLIGVVQLRRVTIEKTKYTYEVVFIGKLKSIFSNLGDDKLNGLDDNGLPLIDFSDLDHGLSKADVENSWQHTDGYVYPLIDYGLSYGFTNTGKRVYEVDNFRPAVFMKNVIDRVFSYAGFTYTSTFFNSTFFKKLIIPWYKESFTLTESQITARQFIAESDVQLDMGTVVTDGSYYVKRLEFADLSDPNDLWNDTTYEFTAGAIGYYKFTSTLSITIDPVVAQPSGILDGTLVVKRLSGGNTTIVDSVPIELTVGATTSIDFETSQELLFTGDDVWVEIYFLKILYDVLVGYGNTVEMDIGSRFFNSVSEQQIFENADVYMNNFVPNVKMSELLLSTFKMFNLYVEVDPLNETNLLIETRSDYYANAPILDWTYKLARDEKIDLEPLGLLTGKEYIYTYSKDEDYYNERYQESRGHAYGRRRFEVDNDFITKKNEVEIVFSPSPLVNDGNSTRIITKIYDSDIDGGRKPTDINIRVLYYGGLLQSNPNWTFRYSGGTVDEDKQLYPYAGHLDNPITPSLDINFGIPLELFYTPNGYTGTVQYTNANLFNTYHRDYISEITDKDSKVMTGMFRLEPLDISELDFRKQILIDNGYWRLNKVMNYNPFKEGLTKVELIKIKDVVTVPARSFKYGAEGYVGTGADIESKPYPNHMTRLNSNSAPFNGTVKGRNNKINQEATAYNVVGDFNSIGSGSTNVTILGSYNSVWQGASNVVIINSDNQEVLESNVTIIDGKRQWRHVDVTTTYDAVDREFILADATAGAFTITLPSVSDSTDVWINVKKTDAMDNDVTVSAGAIGFIDGAATQTLSTQYDAVDFFCDGSNWYIR
jgi:hypothetical protein